METACRVPVDDPEYPTVKSCYTKDLELTGENTLSLYRIYRAHVRQSGKETVKHVVKILDLEKPNPSGGTSDVTLSDVQKEVAVMRGCSHENIVRLHTSFAVESELWMVLDYMNRGSCLDQIRGDPAAEGEGSSKFANGFKIPVLKWILVKTLHALVYLHKQNMIHRDIKAGNILLDDAWNVKVTDFWRSSNLDGEKKKKVMTFVGSPYWMAPEVAEQEAGYDSKADIWSLGITTMELAQGKTPFDKQKPLKVLKSILFQDPPRLVEKFDDDLRTFVAKCLVRAPAERLSAHELLENTALLQNYKNIRKPDPAEQLLDVHRLKEIEQSPGGARERRKSMASDGDNATLEGETWDISYETLENLKQGKWTESEIEAKDTELVEQTRRRSLLGNDDEDLNQDLRELDVPETVGEESSSFVAPQPDGADLIARSNPPTAEASSDALMNNTNFLDATALAPSILRNSEHSAATLSQSTGASGASPNGGAGGGGPAIGDLIDLSEDPAPIPGATATEAGASGEGYTSIGGHRERLQPRIEIEAGAHKSARPSPPGKKTARVRSVSFGADMQQAAESGPSSELSPGPSPEASPSLSPSKPTTLQEFLPRDLANAAHEKRESNPMGNSMGHSTTSSGDPEGAGVLAPSSGPSSPSRSVAGDPNMDLMDATTDSIISQTSASDNGSPRHAASPQSTSTVDGGSAAGQPAKEPDVWSELEKFLNQDDLGKSPSSKASPALAADAIFENLEYSRPQVEGSLPTLQLSEPASSTKHEKAEGERKKRVFQVEDADSTNAGPPVMAASASGLVAASALPETTATGPAAGQHPTTAAAPAASSNLSPASSLGVMHPTPQVATAVQTISSPGGSSTATQPSPGAAHGASVDKSASFAPAAANSSVGSAGVEKGKAKREFKVTDHDSQTSDAQEMKAQERKYRDMEEDEVNRLDIEELRRAMKVLQQRVKELEKSPEDGLHHRHSLDATRRASLVEASLPSSTQRQSLDISASNASFVRGSADSLQNSAAASSNASANQPKPGAPPLPYSSPVSGSTNPNGSSPLASAAAMPPQSAVMAAAAAPAPLTPVPKSGLQPSSPVPVLAVAASSRAPMQPSPPPPPSDAAVSSPGATCNTTVG